MSSPLSERTKQRRRLLKAAAGIPAIVVLPVGAQTAAGSLTCVDKGRLENPDPPVDIVATPDVWVREELSDGTYKLVIDQTSQQPVAHGSCWNSINPTGQRADSDNILR